MSDYEERLDKAFGKKPTGERSMLKTVRDDDPSLAVKGFPLTTDSKPVGLKPPPENIFRKAADNTDFQRFITWIIKQVDPMFKGVTTRDNKLMLSQINERAAIANQFTKLVRGSKMDYRECMNELEMVLKERAERLK